MDIVTVLDEQDPLLWAIRIAGHAALVQMEEKAAAKNRRR